jgi:hypothetical protein
VGFGLLGFGLLWVGAAVITGCTRSIRCKLGTAPAMRRPAAVHDYLFCVLPAVVASMHGRHIRRAIVIPLYAYPLGCMPSISRSDRQHAWGEPGGCGHAADQQPRLPARLLLPAITRSDRQHAWREPRGCRHNVLTSLLASGVLTHMSSACVACTFCPLQ